MKKILKDRAKLYGDFKDVATISQELKKIMSSALINADDTTREGLEMILHKLARIASVPHGCKVIDNFADISGYASLVVKHLERTPGNIVTIVEYKETK